MLTKSKAIVLRNLKYGDQKLIVDLYTEACGRVTSAIKISATPKGKMKKQLFQPLTVLNIEMDYRQNSQMQKLTDVQIAVPWTMLHIDPVKMTVGMFLAEVMCHVTRSEQQDLPLFQFITTSLQWLDMAECGVANFHIAFLVRMTRFLGFMPSGDDYAHGMMFDMRTGEFVALAPLHKDFLNAAEASRMHDILRINYQNMHLFRMSRSERQKCLDVILDYYRLHAPSFPEIKSLQVMREIFEFGN